MNKIFKCFLFFILWFVVYQVIAEPASFFQNSGLVIQPTVTNTSGGTTVLVATSNQTHIATGTLTHTYQLPDETLVPSGWFYDIWNNSTGQVLINDSGGGGLSSMKQGDRDHIISKSNAGSTGNWTVAHLTPQNNTYIGALKGVTDDFATQYLNTTRGDARYFTQAQHISSFTGLGFQPIETTAAGLIPLNLLPGGVGAGSVTSVGVSAPVDFTVAGSPITTNGTIALGYRAATANLVFAGPSSGGNTNPLFRSLVAADMPASVLTNTLTNTHLLVGSAGNVATDVALSQDATLANTGALTLATVNGNVGSFTSANITVNAKGLITAAASGGGGVTSIGVSAPLDYIVANSPVTTSGTIALAYRAATANQVFAGPTSGGNVVPSFRTLVGSDLPATTVQTNQSNTYTSGTQKFLDGTGFQIANTSDTTKLIQYDLSGITTATTRTITATDNNTFLGALSNTFQKFVNPPLVTATTTTGPAGNNLFYSSITNRAPMTDFNNDLRARWGTQRLIFQHVYPVYGEIGPSGARVWAVEGDKDNQVRFVGNISNTNDLNGARPTFAANITDFFEVTCLCTGVNLLTTIDTGTNARNVTVSIDGQTAGPNLFPASATALFNNISTPHNQILPAMSGQSYAMHTFRFTNNSASVTADIYGVELLNENANIIVSPGIAYDGLSETITAASQTVTATSSVTGTTGGRILLFQAATGGIVTTFQAASSTATYVQFASHTNEEVSHVYNTREFGAYRSDSSDFHSLGTTASSRSFVLDDAATSLQVLTSAYAITAVTGEGLNLSGQSAIFTFIGTGVDIVNANTAGNNGTWETFDIVIDGTTRSSAYGVWGSGLGNTVPLVAGLPYGTHTLGLTSISGANNHPMFQSFIVYQPKTPALPANSMPIASYNVLANFAANSTGGEIRARAEGVIRHQMGREGYFVSTGGSWTYAQTSNIVNGNGPIGATSQAAAATTETCNFAFFGTGFDYRYRNSSGVQTATISVDGSTNFTSQSWSVTTSGGSFVPSTGVLTLGTNSAYSHGIRITGFSPAFHKVIVSSAGGATGIDCEAFDVVTQTWDQAEIPISIYQSSGNRQGATLLDKRPVQAEKKVRQQDKNVCTAIAANSSPTTASTAQIPVADLNCEIMSTRGRLQIAYSVENSNSAAGSSNQFQVYVDGLPQGTSKNFTENVLADSAIVADSIIVHTTPGMHNIHVYWKVSANTGTLTTLDRSMIVSDY